MFKSIHQEPNSYPYPLVLVDSCLGEYPITNDVCRRCSVTSCYSNAAWIFQFYKSEHRNASKNLAAYYIWLQQTGRLSCNDTLRVLQEHMRGSNFSKVIGKHAPSIREYITFHSK